MFSEEAGATRHICTSKTTVIAISSVGCRKGTGRKELCPYLETALASRFDDGEVEMLNKQKGRPETHQSQGVIVFYFDD